MIIDRELLKTPGMENLAAVVKKWEMVSKNTQNLVKGEPILIPDMLWKTPAGIGKTDLLAEMAQRLESLRNVMDFYGDVLFFEFYLEYCRPEEPFTELTRLMEEVDKASGFRNEYRGIIHVDIGQWIGKTDQRYFKTFLEYLADNSDNWLIVLSMPNEKTEEIARAEALISAYLRVEVVELSLPDDAFLVQRVQEYLQRYDVALQPDAIALLTQSIGKLRTGKYFDGYKTVNMLCRDIIYELFSGETYQKSPLTPEDLQRFAPDSAYIERMIVKSETRNANRIGF